MVGLAPLSALGKALEGIPAAYNAHSAQVGSNDKFDLLGDADQIIKRIHLPKACDLSFIVNGIPLHIHNTPAGENSKLTIWGVLGYLPYSVTSYERRNNMLVILESVRGLKNAQFGIDGEMRVVVTGSFEIAHPPSSHYFFAPLIQFLQEALPFTTLIGEQL